MNKETFWKIIDEVNSETNPHDQDAIIKATQKKLMDYPPKEIIDWHKIKETYMLIARRNDLWAACIASNNHSSDDGFIDFRSWLISQGEEIYMNAVSNPDSLADLDGIEGQADFESYNYVAYRAYSMKMALEEGLETLLSDYDNWTKENADELAYRYYKAKNDDYYPISVTKSEFVAQKYTSYLEEKYDIYNAFDKQRLKATTIDEIYTESLSKPDIEVDWRDDDLSHIVPRLWEKYNMEIEDEFDMDL